APPAGWFVDFKPATVIGWGNLDPAGQGPATTQPTSNSTTGTITAFKRGGVPDIAQKTNECGPTSTANSLRWLAAQHPLLDPGGAMPASDDDLIKQLMKAMTGNDSRPFGGLMGNQLYDGKKKYAEDKGLNMVVKG